MGQRKGRTRASFVALAAVIVTIGTVPVAGAFATGEDLGGPSQLDHRLPDRLKEQCVEHPPIEITEEVGPEGFILGHEPATGQPIYRPGSGVVDGRGTADDPYIIEGWCIAPGLNDPAIRIADTTSHVVVRGTLVDGRVGGDGPDVPNRFSDIGVRLEDAVHIEIEDVAIVDGLIAPMQAEGVRDLSVRETTIERNHGIPLVVRDSEDVRVAGTTFSDNYATVSIRDSDDVVLRGNLFEEARHGPSLWNVSGAAVVDNVLRQEADELSLTKTTDGQVSGNVFDAGGLDLGGSQLAHFEHAIPPTNIVDGHPIRYVTDAEDRAFTDVEGQLVLVNATDVTVAGVEVADRAIAVQAAFSDNVTVRDSSFSDNDVAISLVEGGGDRVTRNVFARNVRGVSIHGGGSYTVDANHLQANSVGLRPFYVDHLEARGNNLVNSSFAGVMAAGSNATVDVRENWWGHPSGPGGGAADACVDEWADGEGSPIHAWDQIVCFTPWLEEPSTAAPSPTATGGS